MLTKFPTVHENQIHYVSWITADILMSKRFTYCRNNDMYYLHIKQSKGKKPKFPVWINIRIVRSEDIWKNIRKNMNIAFTQIATDLFDMLKDH